MGRSVRWASERVRATYWYRRLRRAYRKHGVLPYSRRATWREARFTVRMKALPAVPLARTDQLTGRGPSEASP